MPPPHRPEFIEFVADIEPSLRRALAEEFGPAAGREATVDALAFAWANWDRVAASDDATAYLLKVGQTAAERHRPLATGDVTPILPRSQAAFDALVPPIGAAAAMDRAAELVSGAPTTMLARPEATTTVVTTTPAASSASAYADGPPTMRLPVPPSPTPGPPMRRTVPWVVAAVLVGVIALGGIALANRSDDGSGGADTTVLPTLPTSATTSTVAASAPAPPPPADTTAPASDTLPPDDGNDDPATTPATRPPSSAATTPPATNPPETDPPDTDPPETDPPDTAPPSSAATTPPSTPPPSTAPPDTTLPPRPTVPDDVTG